MNDGNGHWEVKVWWTDSQTLAHFEAGCHVAREYAATAQEALAVCLKWRTVVAHLDGFSVDWHFPA